MASYLSADCPVVVAPAMDEDMWKHPSTRGNLEKIQSWGNLVIPVEKGELASGLYGDGRMAEPEAIIQCIDERFFLKKDLAGKKVLVTAGPTQEPIDPVRFIGNHSSGKMGIAISEELAARGAEVSLVIGPTSLSPAGKGIRTIKVNTAEEMYRACVEAFPSTDVAIMSAAVADYAPLNKSDDKIKKGNEDLSIDLVKTKDILKSLGERKVNGQILVGFALETRNEKEYAVNKLRSKNADLIVMNSLNDQGAGFGVDTNKITIFEKNGNETEYELKSKKEVARDIVDRIVNLIHD
jgi:phosphopantothenoylcysteine decarboxylase/phosphopantothenate--cysteine ligase